MPAALLLEENDEWLVQRAWVARIGSEASAQVGW